VREDGAMEVDGTHDLCALEGEDWRRKLQVSLPWRSALAAAWCCS